MTPDLPSDAPVSMYPPAPRRAAPRPGGRSRNRNL
jgi:hypothetical protein